jgi:Amt family ammonium transporter
MIFKRLLTIAILLAIPSSSALASDGLNSGDTAWIIVSTALVMMMWGYTLSFGPDKAGVIGGLSNAFMAGIGVDSLSGSIPTYVFALFQMTFACITVALVLGSIVDRMKFSSWIVFTILWLRASLPVWLPSPRRPQSGRRK